MTSEGYVSTAALHQAEDLLCAIEAMGANALPAFITKFEQVIDDDDVSPESRTLAKLMLAGTRAIAIDANWRDGELSVVRESIRRQKLGVAA
jgi:hypothetical protein